MDKLKIILNNFARDDWGHLYTALSYKNNFWQLINPANLGPWYYRPVSQQFYFLFNYNFFGLNPLFFHISNILLHTISIFLLFSITKKLINKTIAYYISISWGLSPINLFSVLWVSGFSMVGGLFFIFLTIFFYLNNKKKLSLYMYVLALCSNEISVFIVPTIFFISLLKYKNTINVTFKNIKIYFYITAIYLGFYYGLNRSPTEEYSITFNLIDNIRVFIKYMLYPFFSGYERGNIYSTFNIFLVFRFLIIGLFILHALYTFYQKKNYNYFNDFKLYILWAFIPIIFLSLIPNHSFAYMGSFSSVGIFSISVISIYLVYSKFMKSIFVKTIYFLFLLSILFVSFNNDSDINWLYKYSKGSAYYVDAFNKNTINSINNNDKTEFTYFGNLQKTIIISSTFSKR